MPFSSSLALLAPMLALIPAGDQVPAYTAEQFYQTTSIMGASFSADESRILVSSDATGVFNCWSYPVDGSPPRALTTSTEDSNFAVSYFPADDRVLFSRDKGGDERTHILVRELDGSIQDLTPGENVKAEFLGWTADGRSFFLTTNERDPNFFDVYLYATNGYQRAMVFENAGGLTPAGISPDGRWLAAEKTRHNADSTIFVIDLMSGEAREATPHQGDVVHSLASFTPDSRQMWYRTNVGSEFDHVRAFGLTGDNPAEHPIVEQASWDVSSLTFSQDGSWRATAINADARTQVVVKDARTSREVRLPDIPRGDITGVTFSRSGARMAFYVNGDTSPNNLHVMDLPAGKPRRLTDSLNPAIKPEHLVESEVVRYKSFDGLEIPAILFKPHGASADTPVPGLVWVHGGPGGQSRTGYSALIQFLVNHGYAVLAVNNRGSSGYGKTFFHADDRDHGGGDLQDCVFGRTHLESLGWVDPERIGIIGGSYGGFMVCAALTLEPEAFDVGVNIFGVTNWIRTLESIPSWWSDFRDALYAEMGDPAVDHERLTRISPLFNADKIARPLMVIQGANDPRVLKVESDEIVEAARAKGVPVEYLVFEDEGHGFLKRENRVEAATSQLDFLERYLRGAK